MAGCVASGSSAGVLTNALELVDCYTARFVYDAYATVFGPGTTFSTVLTGALVLYVAIFGIQAVLGTVNLALGQVGPRLLKIGFIVALLSAWPTFQLLVADLAFNAPGGIAREMLVLLGTTAANETGVIGALDAFYDRMMDVAAAYIGRASIADFDQFLAACVAWGVAGIAMIFAFGFLLVSKLATALVLGVGPLFIALYLFGGTRGLFEGWLRALVTFALVPLFLLTSLAMLMAIVAGTVDTVRAEAIAGRMTWDNLILLVVIVAGFALLFAQIPNVTASIAGGISIAGVAQAVSSLGLGVARPALGASARTARFALRAGTLGAALANPRTRAATVTAVGRMRDRMAAGLGERAQWWNRVATTPGLRHAHRSAVLDDAGRIPFEAKGFRRASAEGG